MIPSITPHFCLWLCCMCFIILFVGYVYWFDHKEYIDDTHWRKIFNRYGLGKEIYNIKHDSDVWFYKGKNTCVGYSEENEGICPKYENYCAGGDNYGTYEQQVKAIYQAIKNEGSHPDCPLIYEGSN